jgi:hypothetical protein
MAHEELYFVAAGRAKFMLDGWTFDAPPERTSSRPILRCTATPSTQPDPFSIGGSCR